MTSPNLLPSNRTPFESAVEATNAARYPLPTDLIKSVWSPDNCPVDLLPYLAWGLSVDIWGNDWPELKKRQVCRDALKLHRLKTTPAGIKAHLALVDTTVKKVIRPPAREHLRGAVTEEARLAWLNSLPQIHIYPFDTKAIAVSRSFLNGLGIHNQFHGKGFKRTSRASSLYGRRAAYVADGVETDVTLSGDPAQLIERIFLATHANKRAFYGHGFLGHQFPTASTAGDDVITINATDSAQTFAVAKGVEPIDIKPQRIAQERVAPIARSFFGRFFVATYGADAAIGVDDTHIVDGMTDGRSRIKRFMRASYGPRLIYDRIALNDPTKMVARRKVLAWHGHGRFGIDPYKAELRISVPMQRKKRTSGAWHGVGFRRAADMAPLNKAIQAVRVSKAFRDTVLIDTQNYERVKFGGGLRFGDFTFGQIIEVD